MMKLKPKYLLKVIPLLILAGCSVKEVRDDCPCRLILDFSETDTLSFRELLAYAVDDVGTVYGAEISAQEFMLEYHLEVMRSRLLVNVCAAAEGRYVPDKGLVIPYGEDCPEIYMHSSDIYAEGEAVRDTVHLHKNHCVLTLTIEKEDSPLYGLCLKGNVNGYGIDGRPSDGVFAYEPLESATREYRAVLPRQKDSSLMLEVDDGTEIVKRFALGELISAGGYDWEAPDLEDLRVHVDWAVTDVVITVQGWGWSYEYEIVI